MVKKTAQTIEWVQYPGRKVWGKQILITNYEYMSDLGYGNLFQSMMWSKGLPPNPEDIDWGQRWSAILQSDGFEVPENRPYTDENYLAYLNWYWKRGMPSIHHNQQNDDAISQPIPQTAPEDVPNLAYVEQGLGIARVVR